MPARLHAFLLEIGEDPPVATVADRVERREPHRPVVGLAQPVHEPHIVTLRDDDHRALRRVGRLGRAELCLLACWATARVGNVEIAILYAEISLAVERQRRAAVDRWGARVNVNHVDVQRSVERLPALARIKPEPATCPDIGTFFKAKRHVHAVAGAVAQRKLGAGR